MSEQKVDKTDKTDKVYQAERIDNNSDDVSLYPKDKDANFVHRYKVISRCANNPEGMLLVKNRCANDILFWINTFVMTYNPRKDDAVIPFISYDFQDDFILELKDHVLEQKDILIDKSRDMGVSWCVLIVFTWFWQFKGEGMDFLCGSRKEEYVDKIGDLKTLMEKIRFIIRNQPTWLRPKGYVEGTHATFMKIRNPETNSIITGESTNENFSRGGRQRGILFDEFAFWEKDAPAWRSAADTTNCRIAVSTPCGYNNHFAKLRHSNSIDTRSLHWRLHPDKTQAWYDNECARRNYDTVEISQELDISYEGSEEGVMFSFDDMNVAKNLQLNISLDRVVLTLDPATEGNDNAVIYVSNNGMISYKKKIKNCTPEQLATEVVMIAKKYNVQVIMGDAIGNDVLAVVRVLLQGSKIKVVEFKSSEQADNKAKFFNRRAEAYFEAAELMKSGNLQVDDDYTLMKQLSATKFKKKNDRILIIPKEEIKLVVGGSPDEADAWVLIPQALKLTHSRREVEYHNKYRARSNKEIVPMGATYGDWNDGQDYYF